MHRTALVLGWLVVWGVFASPATAVEITAEQVTKAIDRGIAFLRQEQSPRGAWADLPGYPGGTTTLATLAMLNCGVKPDDPAIRKALAEVRKIEVGPTSRTYVIALQTMVLAIAEPDKDRVLIKRNVKWLEETQIKKGERNGMWSYPGANGDNSNTQFALLALHEADRVGVEVSKPTWQRSLDYWNRTQNHDGSWGYYEGIPGSGSMTSAGIASLVICAGSVTAGDASVEGNQVQCCGEQLDDRHLQDALQWMDRNFSVERNPGARGLGEGWIHYYLYGVERVGRMTARRFIGKHDWYREGAAKLLADQDPLGTGAWKGTGGAEDNKHIATSLSLLFLSKGRRPVVVAKLKHGPGDDWNHHRNDLGHLTAFTEQQWKRDLTWQVIDPKAAQVEDLLQAPVLFISGREAPRFSDDQKKDLRDYIDRGGFIFAEACCRSGGDFDKGFRQLMEDVFSEPEYQLRLLPPEHPVWHAQLRVDPEHLKPLWGIDYGCRTAVVYCPQDLSCYWELGGGRRDQKFPPQTTKEIAAALAIGVNVLTYATGREPKFKDAIPLQLEANTRPDNLERGTITIAKLVHGGGCNAAPAALANLLRSADKNLQIRVNTEDLQISLTDPKLFHYHMLFMHGRHNFRFTPEERQRLRTYVERGGTLFADALCANREFADAFRREMKATFPTAPLASIAGDDPLLTPEFGGFDIRTVTRRDPGRRVAGQPLQSALRKVEPTLEAIQVGERYGVIFSPYDISCALEKHAALECNGYIPEDAARIGINVLLYTLHK